MIDVRTYNEHMQALATTLSELAARVRQLEAVQIPLGGVLGPHDILSVTHPDSTPAAVVRGDIITGQGLVPTWTRLAAGGANTVLTSDGTDLSWQATAAVNHDLLSAVHPDTDPDSPVSGDIIRASDDPASLWERYPIGTHWQLLGVNAGQTLPEWQSFDWDFHVIAAGGDGVHDHSNDSEGGLLPVGSITAHALLSATHSGTAPAAVVLGDIITGQAGPLWTRLAISVPAANVRNVLSVDNGETGPSWKAALDANNPTAITVGAAAAPGTSLIFSHRDHQHATPTTWTATAHNLLSAIHGDTTVAAAVRGDVITAQTAGALWTRLAISAPAATYMNYLGTANGDVEPSYKALFDANNPTTIAAGAAAAPGSATVAARRDHTHGAPATYPATAHNLLSATHGDATVQAVSRGSVITGQGAAPTWNELVIGGLGAGSVLTRDANEVLWSAGALSFAGAFTLTIPATGTAVLGGGSGAATRVAYWSDANTLTSDAGLTVDAANNFYLVSDAGGIGNSAASARLGFDSSGATDYAYFSDCNVGVNTSTPDAVVEIVGEYYDIAGADVRGLYISGTYSEISENHHPCRVSSLHDLGTDKAVACFDADGRTTGTRNHDHMVGFQSRPRHGSTGTIRSIGGFTASLYNDGGRATQTYCYYANDLNSGNSDCHYGLWVEPLVTGDENVAIYVQTPTMSIFEGVVGFGDFGTPGSGADVPEGLVHCKTDTYTETGLFERIFKTDGVGTALRVLGTKTTDMGDGAGAEVGFLIQDDAAVLNFIGGIGAYRNGADNTGNVRIATRNAGVAVVTATFTYQGRTGLGTVSPSGMVHIDQSAAAGAIPALYLDQGDVSEQHIVLSMNGADQDFPNILQLDVTGSPALWWDESENAFGWKNINGLLVEDADWIGNSSTTARLVFDSSGANDYVNFANCTVFINDTANTKMPHPGLTIRQTDDYEIISLKNSDCDHPMTDETEADTFLRIYPADVGVNRGSSPQIDGFVDDDADRPGAGIWIGGNAYSADSTDTAASVGCVNLIGYESDGGTGRQAVGNDDNVIGFHNAGNTIAVMKGDGDLFLAGAVTENDWDEHDDLALLDGLRLKERFARWSTYARPILEASNVVKYNQDGPDFISVRNLQMLTVDALRQFATQALAEIATLKQRVAILEAA